MGDCASARLEAPATMPEPRISVLIFRNCRPVGTCPAEETARPLHLLFIALRENTRPRVALRRTIAPKTAAFLSLTKRRDIVELYASLPHDQAPLECTVALCPPIPFTLAQRTLDRDADGRFHSYSEPDCCNSVSAVTKCRLPVTPYPIDKFSFPDFARISCFKVRRIRPPLQIQFQQRSKRHPISDDHANHRTGAKPNWRDQ